MSTTHMHELNEGRGADVDTAIMPLIKFMNKLGVKTVSSRPGDDLQHAQVRVVGTYLDLVDVLFRQVQPMIVNMDQAHVQITWVDGVWVGTLGVARKHLDELTSRVGCWLEMLHK